MPWSRLLGLSCAMGLCFAPVHLNGGQAQSLPRFFASADVVRIDVSVFDGKGPVTGLDVGDFSVKDSGIDVEGLAVRELSNLPIDLVLVSDPFQPLSGKQLALFERSVKAVSNSLRPHDRLGVIVSGTPPQRVRGLADAGQWFDRSRLAGTSESAVWDATGAALMEFDASETRKILLILSAGIDRFSLLKPDRLGSVVAGLDIQLVFLGAAPSLQGTRYTWPGGQAREESIFRNTFPSAALQTLAKTSGGQVIDLREQDPDEAISTLLERLRSGYLISYRGVGSVGWHPISIKVKRGGVHVNARAGYFVRRF